MILIIEIRDYEIRHAIAINIPSVNAHPCLGHAVLVICYFGIQSCIFEGAVVFIDEKEIRRCIPRDEEIGPAIIIHVDGNNTQGSAGKFLQA